MQRPLVLIIAALAGLVLVWLIVVRPQQPVAAPAKQPVVQAPPKAETIAPAAVESVESKPVVATGPGDMVPDTKPSEPPKPVAPPAVSEAPSDAESEDENAEPPADESGTGDSDGEDSGPGEIDIDHATDLLADILARREATDDSSNLPNASVQTLKKFNKDGEDAEWSAKAEQDIEATLTAWLAGLPGDAQNHIALIHLECHATMCQVLAADNDADTRNERGGSGAEWQQAIASLPQHSWWHELGFVDLNTEVDSSVDGYAVYMTYLLRQTPAPSGTVEVPDGATNPDAASDVQPGGG